MQDSIKIQGKLSMSVNRHEGDNTILVSKQTKFNKLLTKGIDQFVKLLIHENANKFDYISIGTTGEPTDVINPTETSLKNEVARKVGTVTKETDGSGNVTGFTILSTFTFADVGGKSTTVKEVGACTSNGIFLDRLIVNPVTLPDATHTLDVSITFTVSGA